MSEQMSAESRAELESYRVAAGLSAEAPDAPDEPVHVALAGALEYALKKVFAAAPDATWGDIADEFVLELSGRVVCIAGSDYDDLITSRRDAIATVKLLRQELVTRENFGP